MAQYTVTTIEGRPAVVLDGGDAAGYLLVAFVDRLHVGEVVEADYLPDTEGGAVWVMAGGEWFTAPTTGYLVHRAGIPAWRAVEEADLDESVLLPHPYGHSL